MLENGILNVGTLKETIISITPAICVLLVTVQVLVMELEMEGITAVLSTQKLVQHVVELMNMKLIGIATQVKSRVNGIILIAYDYIA